MKKIAIIFAGGVGKRMKGLIPKQFLTIYGKPIIIHTLEKFQENDEIDQIYVGCKKEYINYLKDLAKKYQVSKIPKNGILEGGSSGQDTIYKVLKRTSENNSGNSIVLIHDGVRPLITEEVISKCIEGVKKYGNAITATPCFETPVISNNGLEIDTPLIRSTVFTAQAPQCFYLKDILSYHETVRKTDKNYTNKMIVDSCSLAHSLGIKTYIVEGNRGNIKVTTVEDYIDLLARFSSEDQKQIFDLLERNKD